MQKIEQEKRRGFPVNTYMTEGVGKRIVDALKKQSEIELVKQPVETAVEESSGDVSPETEQVVEEQTFAFDNNFVSPQPAVQQPVFPQAAISGVTQNLYSSLNTNFSDLGGLEVPANVAVLRQLIAQLPSGVSRQAGALVIKQTMEALGISMKSVLSEAQQLQENLNASARDCQNNILECKKQINTLEAQVQQYQKQSASLNDIVSLFLQLN